MGGGDDGGDGGGDGEPQTMWRLAVHVDGSEGTGHSKALKEGEVQVLQGVVQVVTPAAVH